jgi:LPXTG-motif cell wall-anchored protein
LDISVRAAIAAFTLATFVGVLGISSQALGGGLLLEGQPTSTDLGSDSTEPTSTDLGGGPVSTTPAPSTVAPTPPTPSFEIIEEGCELWGLVEGPDGSCVEPSSTTIQAATALPDTGADDSKTIAVIATLMVLGGSAIVATTRRRIG